MKKDLRVEMSLTISVAEILMGFHCVLKSLCNIRMLPARHTLRGTFFLHILSGSLQSVEFLMLVCGWCLRDTTKWTTARGHTADAVSGVAPGCSEGV